MIRDNPVLRREWLRFSRQWVWWLLALALAWAGLSWVLRHWLPAQYFGMAAWQLVAADTLQMVLRADLPIALFIVYRCATEPYWHGMREEFALRFVAPREILFGKIALPIVVMASMNVFGVYLNYREVLVDPTFDVVVPVPWLPAESDVPAPAPTPAVEAKDEYDAAFFDPQNPFAGPTTVDVAPFVPPPPPPRPRGIVVSAGIPVTIFGLLEDFLYSATMVLIAAHQFFFRREPMLAAMHALWRIALVGACIAIAGWVWTIASMAMPYRMLAWFADRPVIEFLLANAVWFSLVLPLETAVIAVCWRRAVRQTEEWLRKDEG